jgi:hypothetical protein
MNSPKLTATTGLPRLNTKFTAPKRIQPPGLIAQGRFQGSVGVRKRCRINIDALENDVFATVFRRRTKYKKAAATKG